VRTKTNKSELGDLLDQHQTIRQAHYQLNNGIPHTKKTIEAMLRGSTHVCELTQNGKSCKCRDTKLSAYADQLRDLESAINARMNPIVPDLARERRDRLRAQARELNDQARNLLNEAQQQAHQLEQRADALVEQSKSDAERAVEAMRAEGREFYETIDGVGHRITVEDRTALVSFGACGCCLNLFYEQVAAPSYAPREGDQLLCHAECGLLGGGFVFARGKWRKSHK
jgi:DNA repair exonuclease SbcCD ATPase subunit